LQNLNYAVKFSFTARVGVTKYFQYEVGSSCVLSVRDVFGVAQVFLYLNPAQDKFHIKADGHIFVEVYDISGNKLKTNKNKEQNISAFGSVIYFVRVSQLETAQSQLFKVVKK